MAMVGRRGEKQQEADEEDTDCPLKACPASQVF
jgi:hypothetical protein